LLALILAESALETVPQGLWGHPAVRKHAERRRKAPGLTLLDRSYHHAAMKALPEAMKRGRPDIVHFTLLEALGSPLNREDRLRVYVHTLRDQVVTVDPGTRLPRNYDRFVSLIEQLFKLGKVPPTGPALLRLESGTLPDLLREVRPTRTVAFTRRGTPRTLEEAVSRLSGEERPAVIIGGFPRGGFTEATVKAAQEAVCIDRETLEAWTVASRVIYEYERATSLPRERIRG